MANCCLYKSKAFSFFFCIKIVVARANCEYIVEYGKDAVVAGGNQQEQAKDHCQAKDTGKSKTGICSKCFFQAKFADYINCKANAYHKRI